MTPNMRDIQLTVPGKSTSEVDDGEEVRLLDSYEEEDHDEKLGENLKRIEVRVTGMTCAACSNSVESALMSIHGVVKASVALLQNKAYVVFDPTLLKDEEITNAIEDAGFEAELLSEPTASHTNPHGTVVGQFTIGGMTCAACVNSVEGILKKLPGVRKAVVALATSLGEVEYDASIISKDDIANAIEDAGFEASFVQSSEQDKIVLGVVGISGEMDAQFLEGILSKLHGVKQFCFDRVSNELEVIFDPEVLGSRSLVDGIEGEAVASLRYLSRALIQEWLPEIYKNPGIVKFPHLSLQRAFATILDDGSHGSVEAAGI